MTDVKHTKVSLYNEVTGFCLICGDHHEKGPCPPENFTYFKCKSCDKIIDMPHDAAGMAMGGGGSMMCGCGAENSFELIDMPSMEEVFEDNAGILKKFGIDND